MFHFFDRLDSNDTQREAYQKEHVAISSSHCSAHDKYMNKIHSCQYPASPLHAKFTRLCRIDGGLAMILPRAAASERDAKGEGEERFSALFMRVARTSVGRTLNVKPALSFTRFKGLVTARNHAARAYTLSYPPESAETSASSLLLSLPPRA